VAIFQGDPDGVAALITRKDLGDVAVEALLSENAKNTTFEVGNARKNFMVRGTCGARSECGGRSEEGRKDVCVCGARSKERKVRSEEDRKRNSITSSPSLPPSLPTYLPPYLTHFLSPSLSLSRILTNTFCRVPCAKPPSLFGQGMQQDWRKSLEGLVRDKPLSPDEVAAVQRGLAASVKVNARTQQDASKQQGFYGDPAKGFRN